jgi:predicted nucleic acid-binding protein
VIVVDSSAMIAVLLREDHAKQVLESLDGIESLAAPAMMPYEVLNALHSAVRRRRLRADGIGRSIAFYLGFPWALDIHSTEPRLREVSRLAEVHGLSAYDASFLELAMRQGCPLVSLDDELRKAAKAEMVEVRPRSAR